MSHVTTCKSVLKNLDVIEKAALRLNGVLNRGQKRARMYGQGFVDDSLGWKEFFEPKEASRIAGLPKSERIKIVNAAMSNFAHTISFKGANYDVGLVDLKDGTFKMRYDEYSGDSLGRIMGPNAEKFMDAYGFEAAKKAARARGYSTKETTNKQGQLQLEVLVN